MSKGKFSRRNFIKFGGTAALAGLVAKEAQAQEAPAEVGRTTLPYPQQVIGVASDMPVNEIVNFSYPDASSPCVAIRMGQATAGGVGPDGDIVAYSVMCTHMGCPVQYDSESRNFKCGCHFSVFDSEKEGQMVMGQATEKLPNILLSYDDASGEVSAVGIDGLLYGRQANIL